MTDELIRRLMAAGLTKQQANSVTAETLVQLFMQDDGKLLMREAQLRVAEMQKMMEMLMKDYADLKQKITGLSDNLLAITEAQRDYGTIVDEKAKTVLALYAALIGLNEKAGASGDEAVRNAGYIVYAYLGGQAKRDYNGADERWKDDPNVIQM